MPVLGRINAAKAPVKVWAPIAEIESAALAQLRNIGSLPWVRHVCAMPDVHLGKGATVGSVIAMKDAVAPAAVGVDIGCGMGAVRTSLSAADLPDDLGRIRSAIEAAIPVGFESHDRPVEPEGDLGRAARALFDRFDELHGKVRQLEGKARRQLGTLGGGNHFVELCLDREDRVWLMLHSGSRNIGKELAEAHIKLARRLEHNRDLPDPDLSVFLAGTPELQAYRRDLYWAQEYAFLNRSVMFELYRGVVRRFFPQVRFDDPILCHHNYVSEETHFGEHLYVTRKGAIRAGRGDLGIIPGSMGTRSYVVRGLGSTESLESASHGAGRRMSRSEARRRFTVKDLAAQTEGVACRKDRGVLDEIPAAYKDIDQVMANQSDLVEIVAELRAVVCVKG